MLKLLEYVLLDQPTLPPLPSPLNYVIAANGMFAWARREGLEALIPVTTCPGRSSIRGLYPATPYLRLSYPRADLVEELCSCARAACTGVQGGQEVLFYLNWREPGGWQLTLPWQRQSAAQVTPVIGEAERVLYASTLFEIHSHHTMAAFFSATDTADEQGFRLYGVIGRIFSKPEICVRVGIYGHFWTIPARWVLAIPPWMTDRGEEQGRGSEGSER